ncbi:peptidase, partial [Acinetobacter baumannii]
AQAFIQEGLAVHLDLKRCKQACFVGGMFAIFLPPFHYVKQHHPNKLFDQDASDFKQQQIEHICLAQLDLAKQLAEYSNDIQICTTVQDIQHCLT